MSANKLKPDNHQKNALGVPAKPHKPVGASRKKRKPRHTSARDIERAERKYFSYEDIANTHFIKRDPHISPLITLRHMFNKLLLTIIYRGKH
jgi:hypothetical protein